jgi:hypothetical protein
LVVSGGDRFRCLARWWRAPEAQRAPALLYVILAILVLNLALTAALWLRTGVSSPISGEPVEDQAGLPPYLDATSRETLASDLAQLYNSEEYQAFYDRFDPLAKIQFSEEDLREQLGQFRQLLGRIEASAYSHHESTRHGDFHAYAIYYKVRLSDGAFPQGDLKVSVIDRGDRAGLFGFLINGTTQ